MDENKKRNAEDILSSSDHLKDDSSVSSEQKQLAENIKNNAQFEAISFRVKI